MGRNATRKRSQRKLVQQKKKLNLKPNLNSVESYQPQHVDQLYSHSNNVF